MTYAGVPLLVVAGRSSPVRRLDSMPEGFEGDILRGERTLPYLLRNGQEAGIGRIYLIGPEAREKAIRGLKRATHIVSSEKATLGANVRQGLEYVAAHEPGPVVISTADICPSAEDIHAVLERFRAVTEPVALTYSKTSLIDPVFEKQGYEFRSSERGQGERYSLGHLFLLRPTAVRLDLLEVALDLFYAFRGDAYAKPGSEGFLAATGQSLTSRRVEYATLSARFIATAAAHLATIDLGRAVSELAKSRKRGWIHQPSMERVIGELLIRRGAAHGPRRITVVLTDLPGLAEDGDARCERMALERRLGLEEEGPEETGKGRSISGRASAT